MAIKFSDVIENINSNYPVVDATGNHIKGVLFSDAASATETVILEAIPGPKRALNCVLIATAEQKIYIYTGTDLSNTEWGNSENWAAISGDPENNPQGGITLGSDPAYDDVYLLTNNNPAIGDFTLETTYTTAIDKLNELMGKIVPTAPSSLTALPDLGTSSTGASGLYNYLYYNTSYSNNSLSKWPYEVARAANQGILAAEGSTAASSNVEVRWVSNGTRNLNIRYTGLQYLANSGDTFQVKVNNTLIASTLITVATASNGGTYTNGANSVTLSPTGYPTQGSGVGFYPTYSTINFVLGAVNTLFTENKMNTISILYNGDAVASQNFYYANISTESDITSAIEGTSVPIVSLNNYENGIRFIRQADVVENTSYRISLTVSASHISGSEAYGAEDYSTSINNYIEGQDSDIFEHLSDVNYPASVAPDGTLTSAVLYYQPKDNIEGLFLGSELDNRPSFGRRSIFGGDGSQTAAASTDVGTFSYIIYKDDPLATSFWSGNVLVGNSTSTSHKSSATGVVANLLRIKDPGSGTAGTAFVDTPSGILNSGVYDPRWCNGSSSDGIDIHDSDAIVVAGAARNLSSTQLSAWFDGNSQYPVSQTYEVSQSRNAYQYVTMGFDVTDALSNFYLTLASDGIAGAWVYMNDNGAWTAANTGLLNGQQANGWCRLDQPWGGTGAPGIATNSPGAQGAAVVNPIPLNAEIDDATYIITSGQANFFNGQVGSSGKRVYLRFKLAGGKKITKLSIAS